MADGTINAPPLVAGKFRNAAFTLSGAPRAIAPFVGLETLWVNTGTLCNIACANCYIESSPTNDRLAYLTREELRPFLAEAKDMGAREIGFTGGEPFMNPDIIAMLGDALADGFSVLVLTNAMRPLMRKPMRTGLSALARAHGQKLTARVSLDHHSATVHDAERGAGAFEAALAGLRALNGDGVRLAVAGRRLSGETDAAARAGYQALFEAQHLPLDAGRADHLVLFPEMDAHKDTPEISTACWDILGKRADDVMCARARMLVKRKGAAAPAILACTLIVDDPAFEMGATLADAARPIALNHPHCSRFCVLGGASCSA